MGRIEGKAELVLKAVADAEFFADIRLAATKGLSRGHRSRKV